MSDSTPSGDPRETPDVQPLRDQDTSIDPDPARDPAQAEWDATTALDEGKDALDQTATGDDPAHLASDTDEIPSADLPPSAAEPDTQGADPTEAALGEDGQGDLGPADL